MQPTQLPEETESIDLRQYLALAWQWAWLIALAVVLAAAAAFFVSRRMTPIYQTTTRLLVSNPPAMNSIDSSAMIPSSTLTQTYSQMLTDTPVLDKVIKNLALATTAEKLKAAIAVQIIPNTQIISVSVSDTNPARAADIANAIGQVFSDRIRQLQSDRYASTLAGLQKQVDDMGKQIDDTNARLTQETDPAQKLQLDSRLTQYRQLYSNLVTNYEQVRLAEAQTSTSVAQSQPAQIPTIPVSPRTAQNTLLAAVVGLMLSVGVIFAIEALDDTLKTPDQITRELGLPILGVITHYQAAGDEGVPITQAQPRSPISEAFRTLRTNVQYTSLDRPLRSILVTSPSPAEGKTTIVSNLAVVMAQGGRRVTVVDADLRRPALHKRFGLANHAGLSGVFVQPTPHLNGALQKTAVANLTALTSGSLPPNPSELLASQRMHEIITQLGLDQELVLLDTPPALAVTDAAVLVSHVDGVLLVVKPGSTKTAAARLAVEALRHVGANLLGVVINNMQLRRSSYSYYYKKYYHYDAYGYGEGRKAAKEPKSMRRFKKSNNQPSQK